MFSPQENCSLRDNEQKHSDKATQRRENVLGRTGQSPDNKRVDILQTMCILLYILSWVYGSSLSEDY